MKKISIYTSFGSAVIATVLGLLDAGFIHNGDIGARIATCAFIFVGLSVSTWAISIVSKQ